MNHINLCVSAAPSSSRSVLAKLMAKHIWTGGSPDRPARQGGSYGGTGRPYPLLEFKAQLCLWHVSPLLGLSVFAGAGNVARAPRALSGSEMGRGEPPSCAQCVNMVGAP